MKCIWKSNHLRLSTFGPITFLVSETLFNACSIVYSFFSLFRKVISHFYCCFYCYKHLAFRIVCAILFAGIVSYLIHFEMIPFFWDTKHFPNAIFLFAFTNAMPKCQITNVSWDVRIFNDLSVEKKPATGSAWRQKKRSHIVRIDIRLVWASSTNVPFVISMACIFVMATKRCACKNWTILDFISASDTKRTD